MLNYLSKMFGSRNDRLVRQYLQVVEKINRFESNIQVLDDSALRAKADQFKQRLADGEALDLILPQAFAVVREASRRVLGMRHYDVQIVGGLALHYGKIAEMKTGEGKTLVATLPAYLNALSGCGVHIITVNDYLAQRDAQWMGKLYAFLGLTTGLIVSQLSAEDRKTAYAADITYGTNSEFGFDYLRDNMVFDFEDKVQRPLHYAIVDEVDSILIDEARTPLIISGAVEDSSDLYRKINALVPSLKQEKIEGDKGHFSLDEKNKQVHLTELGHEEIERLLEKNQLIEPGSSVYDAKNIALMHHVSASLRAHYLFMKDVDYLVKSNQVIIVDEFTGRTMEGRRWSDGLHQAIEAKEKVAIQSENQTLASITYQNYFRLYTRLSGMTGTADTEAPEFLQIYGLEVVVIPTHRLMIRDDLPDLVYMSSTEKFQAVIKDIQLAIKKKQPVLVGTASIEISEFISKLLKQANIKHQVLNAKQHEKEAHVIACAGEPATVTIATNMAGRGTDIILGGNIQEEISARAKQFTQDQLQQLQTDWQKRHDQVLAAGGLHIIGTERHESRRIDNQLRGRAGRQGDPGSTRFYLSLEDDLMRIFASDKVAPIMQKLGMKEGEAIEHRLVSRAIANAQKKVEAHNFDIRKNLLEYDDVANDQRKVIYEQRDELMKVESISGVIDNLWKEQVQIICTNYIPAGSLEEQWDIEGLEKELYQVFGVLVDAQQALDRDDSLYEETLIAYCYKKIKANYDDKRKQLGELIIDIEKNMMLGVVDANWKEHLAAMDYLRQGIGLRGYAQKNPKQEYKKEAFAMFSDLLDAVKRDVVSALARIDVRHILSFEQAKTEPQPSQSAPSARRKPGIITGKKIRRNAPCPCGSGKKYKHCHGRVA